MKTFLTLLSALWLASHHMALAADDDEDPCDVKQDHLGFIGEYRVSPNVGKGSGRFFPTASRGQSFYATASGTLRAVQVTMYCPAPTKKVGPGTLQWFITPRMIGTGLPDETQVLATGEVPLPDPENLLVTIYTRFENFDLKAGDQYFILLHVKEQEDISCKWYGYDRNAYVNGYTAFRNEDSEELAWETDPRNSFDLNIKTFMGEGSNNKCSKKVTELYLERLNKVDPDPAKTEMTDPKRRKNEKRLASTKVRLEKLQKKMSGKDKDQEKICKELYKLHKKTNRVFAAEAKADLLSLCGLMAGELGCCGTYDPFRC